MSYISELYKVAYDYVKRPEDDKYRDAFLLAIGSGLQRDLVGNWKTIIEARQPPMEKARDIVRYYLLTCPFF